MQKEYLGPFLKWPGGKRWFVKKQKDYFPQSYNRYLEPFLGGGAVFFDLQPKDAILSDINDELINLYIVMREKPDELKEQMLNHQKKHNRTYYYEIRDNILLDPIERASRMLYLNRTCFNGMYRVNKEGVFNVPIGTKKDCIYDIENFGKYANCLKCATILANDFYNIINQSKEGDFIFADPPYATTINSNFVKYNNNLFGWNDQLRLHEVLVRARDRGVKIMLTNACCREIIEMYRKDGFYIHILTRASTIAGEPKKRREVKELLIVSYRKPKKRGKDG